MEIKELHIQITKLLKDCDKKQEKQVDIFVEKIRELLAKHRGQEGKE